MAADPRIQHIVVLMMENRSFDHLLGMLGETIPHLDGAQPGVFYNLDRAGRKVFQTTGARYQGQLRPDPPHEFPDVDRQIFGQPRAPAANMSGFALNYDYSGGNPQGVMRCFEPEQLPVISTLATNFLVCNRWFASVPGPTSPNRAFAHFGTSFGRVDSGVLYTGKGEGIYGRMARAGKRTTLYYYSPASGTLGMTFLPGTYFGTWGQFKADCQRGDLPEYSFVEPPYNEGYGLMAADMHPDHNVRAGDTFVGMVYDAIRSNDKLWSSTLLLIVWDEHGGFYDHVPPPVLGYRDSEQSGNPPFAFDRLGVRVPAILVSPYVQPGVNSDQFEHASIPATATEQFIGSPATFAQSDRERNARTFLSLLSPGPARTDRVSIAPADLGFGAAGDDPLVPRPDAPASELQREHLREVHGLLSQRDPAAAAGFRPELVKTESEVNDFIARAMAILHPETAGMR